MSLKILTVVSALTKGGTERAAQNFAESAAQSPSLAAFFTSIVDEIIAESAAQTQKLAAQSSEEPTTTKAAA